MCDEAPVTYARELSQLASELESTTVEAVIQSGLPSRAILEDAHQRYEATLGRMVAVQEELDWRCYQSYGLSSESFCYDGDDLPPLRLGERAFEITWAQKISNGDVKSDWFQRHSSDPITVIPSCLLYTSPSPRD